MSNHSPEAQFAGHSVAHPTQEEWMSFLYGEAPRHERNALAKHLADCAVCQEQVRTWKQTMTGLSQWQLPARLAAPFAVRPALKWAAVALVLLGLGFGFGRFTTPSSRELKTLQSAWREEVLHTAAQQWQTQLVALRASLAEDLLRHDREQLDRLGEGLSRFAAAYDQQRQREYQTILTTLRQLESQRALDRTDLETLAVATQGAIEHSREELGKWVAFNQSAADSALPQDHTPNLAPGPTRPPQP